MNDLISRQEAIDMLEERLQANGYSNVDLVSELNRSIGYLMRLPSAQPNLQPTCNQLATDCISRQAAINAIENTECELTPAAWDEITDAINELPSAYAVEVVRCKNCAKCQVDTIFDQYWCGGERVLPNGFCNYGRRKNG